MSFEEFKEHMKSEPHGKEALEDDDKFLKAVDEMDLKLSTLVVWLTGLSIGEVAFVLTNLDKVFIDKGKVFISAVCFLLFSICGGLFYHCIRIIKVSHEKQIYSYKRQISIAAWAMAAEKMPNNQQNERELYKSIGRFAERLPLIQKGINLSAFVNIVAFFLGSLLLIWLTAIILFKL